MAESIDQRERRELCDLLLELGPDAPTLCEGWTTLDMAAHLVLREHFRPWGEARMANEKAKGLEALVERLRSGTPLVPWRLPGLGLLFNGTEMFIHHEDVRRANGMEPREANRELDDMSWRMLRFIGWRAARKMRPFSITLITEDGRRRSFGSGEGATLRGRSSELLVHLTGRCDAAEVDVTGSDEALSALRSAAIGL